MKRHSANQRPIELASIPPIASQSIDSPNRRKFPTNAPINSTVPKGSSIQQEGNQERKQRQEDETSAFSLLGERRLNHGGNHSRHSAPLVSDQADVHSSHKSYIEFHQSGRMNGPSQQQRPSSSSSSLSSSSSPDGHPASAVGPLSTSTSTSTNRRRSEVDPLLVPPYDPNYSTAVITMDTPTTAGNAHTNNHNDVTNHNQASASKRPVHSSASTHNAHHHRNDDETIVEFDDEEEELLPGNSSEQNLLIVDKPLAIRTQQSSTNVFLLNFLALAFVAFNMTLNLTVLAIIHERVPMGEPHLPDIAFDILPDIRSLLDVSEYYIVFQMTSVFVLLFFHRHRSIILRRVCIIMGVIYFFRGICMASTQLPLASKNYTCSPQLKNSTDYANMTSLEFIGIISQRVFAMSLGMGLSINGHHNYCGDYIFSGHTVILLLTYLTFQEYLLPARRKNLFWRLYQILLIVMTLVSIVCIIIARGHYFIDVILAYFVTTRIFWIYHAMCNSSLTSMRSFTSYFSRLWWWPVFLYFENIKPVTNGHSIKSDEPPNPVQRVFEWPLPYPKQLARRKHRNQFMA